MPMIMFVVPPFYGHITATLSVGSELISRGNKVCWVAMKSILHASVPDGGQWIVPAELEPHQDEIELILQRQNIGTKISGFEALDFGLHETMLPFAKIMSKGMQSVIDQMKPDCIIHDETALAGAVFAVKNSIPYATSITAPPGFFEPNLFFPERQALLLDKMREIQKSMGVESDRVIFNSDRLILSYTSRDIIRPNYGDFIFEGPITFVGATVESRPEAHDFDWSTIKNPHWPTVYVSIGTVLDDIRSTIFNKIIAALHDAPINVIANTDPALFESWPQNFIVQELCPQIEILEKVDLVITHGGFNTINEALYFDKPLIVLPLAWDQSPNADLVVQNGCGLKFKYRRLAASELKDAVFQLIDFPIFKENAIRLGVSTRALGGTKKAADLIENLISENSK